MKICAEYAVYFPDADSLLHNTQIYSYRIPGMNKNYGQSEIPIAKQLKGIVDNS